MVNSSYQKKKKQNCKVQLEMSNGDCVTPAKGWLAIKWNMQWERNIRVCFWSLHRWFYECSHPPFYHLLIIKSWRVTFSYSCQAITQSVGKKILNNRMFSKIFAIIQNYQDYVGNDNLSCFHIKAAMLVYLKVWIYKFGTYTSASYI